MPIFQQGELRKKIFFSVFNPFVPKPRQPLSLSHARVDAAIAKIANKSVFDNAIARLFFKTSSSIWFCFSCH